MKIDFEVEVKIVLLLEEEEEEVVVEEDVVKIVLEQILASEKRLLVNLF